MIMKINVPIRLISEANNTDHWREKHKRKKKIKALLDTYCPRKLGVDMPCTVQMTRISPRHLDFDNLVHAFKACYDYICDRLRPGLAPGRADDTDLITPLYSQEKGKHKEYAIRIEIYSKKQLDVLDDTKKMQKM